MTILAIRSLRTESCHVIHAGFPSNVAVLAMRSVFTEPSLIPKTVLDEFIRFKMEERAVWVIAFIVRGVKVTGRHFREIVFMEKLAVVRFLT